MKSCLGCFTFLLVIASLSAIAQGIGFLLANYWTPILGLGGAWISHRYVQTWYSKEELE